MDHIISNLKKEDALLEQEIANLQSRRAKLKTAMAALAETATVSSSQPVTVIEVGYTEGKEETSDRNFRRANYGITHAMEYIFRVLLPEGKSLQYTVIYTQLRDKFHFTELTYKAFENVLNYHASRGWIKRVKDGDKVSYACGQRREWYENTPRTVTVRNSILNRLKKNN